MPTLGPSILFAAGLALGVGTGVLIPRRAKQDVFTPPQPTSGEKRDITPIKTPGGGVVHLQGGFPGPVPDVIKRAAYTAAYDRKMRHPAWTAEHLTAASLSRTPPPSAPNASPIPLDTARAADTAPATKGDRSKSVFMEDADVPEMFRAKLQDYFKSGYDRGHMVPAADAKISQQAMNETFYLSNIAPQVGDGFNRHYWAYLEDFCRRLTTNFEDVYVFTVPLYLPTQQPDGKWRVTYEVIGSPPSISVPTHFAKVILASRPDFSFPQSPSTDKGLTNNSTIKELAMGAFILPNKEIPDHVDLKAFIAPVEAVEKAAGLQLFNTELKGKSKQLCAVTQCQVIVRRFDDARKDKSKNLYIMPPLLYPLPSTNLLSLGASTFIDPSSSHTTHLADATQARTKFQIALKAFADKTGSAVQTVDAILGYLPYITGISTCLDNDELIWKSDPAFHWRPSLTHYISTPTLPLPSIHAEHLFVLLTYTLALSNYAHSILATLPTPSDHITAEEEKRITAGLARSVDLLCQAAGIAEWTAENVCPSVESARNASGRLGKNRWPVETGAEAFRGLAMTLIADAHLTAIRKLLLPVLPHMLFAPPGPPLPSNHPSPSLLAKLYLHVASLYTSASGLLRSHADTRQKGGDEGVDGEIIPELKRYLRKESLLAGALAHKWLGVDAGENSKGAKIGEAVAWVKEAQARLQELEEGKVREKMKGLSFGKGSEKKKEERKARKGRVERELEDVAAWLKTYTRMNDTVSFQPVPPISALTVPSGRPIFGSKPFKPPPSKMVAETKDDSVDEYAGKGSYY